MDKTHIERRVYSDAEVKRGHRVSSIRCVREYVGTKPTELVKVPNLTEYGSGCGVHRGSCFGHMCERTCSVTA